jgi:type II secretory pathway pseudopilin PulG
MRGATLLEQLLVMVLILVVLSIAIPVMDRQVQEARARGAAFYMSGRCALLRMQAVHRDANVGLRFVPVGTSWRFQTYVDGDWDGVRAADIATGRDPAIDSANQLEAQVPGTMFGFVPGCPLIDGSAVPSGASPVRIGSAQMITFTPAGTTSGGTLYVRGGPHASGYAVVMLAATGRTRLLRCLPGSATWSGDAR